MFGNKDNHDGNYVFPILNNKMTAYNKYNASSEFVKQINNSLKGIAKQLDFPADFSTYYARHSYATNLRKAGKPLEFVQGALGHKNKRTTEIYFSGIENNELREANERLLDF